MKRPSSQMLPVMLVMLLSLVAHASVVSPDDEVELIVRYKNDRMPKSTNRSNNRTASRGNDEDNEADARMFNTAIINTQRKNIEHLEEDERIQLIGESSNIMAMTVDAVSDDAKQSFPETRRRTTSLRRLSDEKDPYGIALVQADQIDAGSTNVKVCIVDSGYALGHEDLPDTVNHGVEGFSPYGNKQKWDKDEVGHGTHHAGNAYAISDLLACWMLHSSSLTVCFS